MIQNLQYIISSTKDPYLNQSLEKYLLDTVKEDTLILYLWQNAPAVFAGPDPEAFRGYSISGLLEDDIMPVRRLSGGKAKMLGEDVLHFTFLSHRELFDEAKQRYVMELACKNPNLSGMDHTGKKMEPSAMDHTGKKPDSSAMNHTNKNPDSSLDIPPATPRRPVPHLTDDSDLYRSGSKIWHHGYLNFEKAAMPAADSGTPADQATDLLFNTILDAFDQVYEAKSQCYPLETIPFSVLRSYEKVFRNEDWIYNGQ